MSDSPYLKIVSGNRITNYMGVVMAEGFPFRYVSNYMAIEIPIRELYLPSEEKAVTKALRNQYVQVIPACTIQARGNYMVEVEANHKLSEYGLISGGNYKVHPHEKQVTPSFHLQLRKDLDLTDIDFAIRLYLIP